MSSPKQRCNTAPPQSTNDILLAALVELCCRVIGKESIRSMDFSSMLSVKFSNANPLVLQRIHSPGRLEIPRCSRRVSGGSICWRCGVSKTRKQVNAKDSLHLWRGRGAVHGTPAPRKSPVEHSTQKALLVSEHKAKSHARD
jgi:hypothetical protein